MCGIIGVVRRRSTREAPDLATLVEQLDRAVTSMHGWQGELATLDAVADDIEAVDALLRGVPGARALLTDRAGTLAIEHRVEQLGGLLLAAETRLDEGDVELDVGLEALNAALVRARDARWAVAQDRLPNARAVADLAGPGASDAAVEAFTSIQVALSAIDRLEVRGRDSAGLHVLVRNHGVRLGDPAVRRLVQTRSGDPLFGSGSVRETAGLLGFVYKAAAEIGELGDNTAALRAAIRDDELLHLVLTAETAEAVVLAHTRWASVGIISEANAHPLDSFELESAAGDPYVAAALNGDVDNHADVRVHDGLRLPAEITTDAKVIPTLMSRRIAGGEIPAEAFRSTVSVLEGSVAIGASTAEAPDSLMLALRGSGQALYVGLAEDAFVVASEPYGLVEETSVYLRMDGETPSDPDRASATRGQVVVIDASSAGTIEGITRCAYDGTPLPVTTDELQHAQITTRDIDRGAYPHFLLKEVSEAPDSFRKTMRGKVTERDGRLAVDLGRETLSDELRGALQRGDTRRVIVIGQGTAAVAGQSLAVALERVGRGALLVSAQLATELSGFGLRDDMSDTLVVAISQSGTTTDTNRTVDLVREHGAHVIAIVNRRNSDLVDKSDGVLYTSDGRDVEMSVASTKAFYAQIAAGWLLALGIADVAGVLEADDAHEVLTALRALPDAMRSVVDRRDEIAAVAQRQALTRRYWAVVGNGTNVIAARELRIKLSELCYKAIACDATEDKKHIDLSSEPMTLVCAAGLGGSNADDVAKEVAIYRAHRGAPVVIASADDVGRFSAALETIPVPAVHPAVDFVLSTVAGHLFCYEAALAIDASARPLREARASIEAAATGDPESLLERLTALIEDPARRFLDGLRAGHYDGTLEASTGARLASLLRYATGVLPLDFYEIEQGKVGTPSTVVQDLTAALTEGIEELTRPVDAIKHQAKTVTVGISRSDETLLQAPLVVEVLAAGAPRDGLSYRALRTLVALDKAVDEVTGFTRYRVEGDLAVDEATLHVVDRGGVASSLRSTTETDPRLRGTKHRVATQREVTAAVGRDGRTLVIVPEVKHNQTVGITLLHARFAEHLPPDVMRAVLQGYQGRYGALSDAVTETEANFDDSVLGTLPVVDLLTDPVYVLADHWRTDGGQ